jgi:hypothetical protein
MPELFKTYDKYVAKITCIKYVSESHYELICWFFTIIDPLCFFIFITFCDRLLDFKKRFVKEFDRNSIEIRHFSVKVGNIPN